MATPGPQPPVFCLVPHNKAARQATNHALNEKMRTAVGNGFGLYISFANAQQVCTVGRAGCDIFLPDPHGADISKHQASFVNITERGAVILEDKSGKKNTEPFPFSNAGQTIGFHGDTRRVLIARGINSMIAFGRDKYYQFSVEWQSDGLYDFPDKTEPYMLGPRKTRRRYIEGEKVGGGSFGTVWSAMDVHTGDLIAVKKFHNMEGKHLEFATREITNLFRINRSSSIHHEHILEILDCAGGTKGDNWGEIFMPLKPGNLKTLAMDPSCMLSIDALAELVLHQMLLALACIARHKIVHRDLKPENVLWELNGNNDYHFRLGDFGLSNNPEKAVTVAGTEPFMAPEVFNSQKQTAKVDIWSLFATIVWVKNTENFRTRCAKMAAPVIHTWLNRVSALPDFFKVQHMASLKPKDRPSAKELIRIMGYDQVGDLADSLADANLGPEEEGVPVPYYEQDYAPNYDLSNKGEGSNAYVAPQVGQSPRAGKRAMEAFVKPIEPPYALPGGSIGSGTAVPDVATARQLPTHTDRKGKAKVEDSVESD